MVISRLGGSLEGCGEGGVFRADDEKVARKLMKSEGLPQLTVAKRLYSDVATQNSFDQASAVANKQSLLAKIPQMKKTRTATKPI